MHFSRYLYAIGLRRNYNENDATESYFSLNELCKNKCKAYISYIPPSAKDNVYGSERYKSHIKKISKKYGIKFIDLQNIISQNNNSDLLQKDPFINLRL